MGDSTLNMQQQISAMDIHADGQLLIAGGRECILKLIELDFSKEGHKRMSIQLNLRRQGVKHAIGYLEFNRIDKGIFLAGSLMGPRELKQHFCDETLAKLIKEHEAAIHRMNWSPIDRNVLISGGHDGIINIYDIGSQNPLVHKITRSSGDPVRDVKFNPFHSNYFLAACESGHFELYDIRAPSKYVYQKGGAHKNLYCLDWNKKYQNIVVSGTTEKELKVWSLNSSHTDMEERVKIQLVDGAAQVKWHQTQPNLVSVASLNRDVSVTTYDIFYPHRPQCVVKGQKDLITSFVFNQDETTIITGAKDGIIMMQPLDQCLDVYDVCPRFPVTFSPNNGLIYKLDSMKQLDLPEYELRKKSSNFSEEMDSQLQFQHSSISSNVASKSLSHPKQAQLKSQIKDISGGGLQLRKSKQPMDQLVQVQQQQQQQPRPSQKKLVTMSLPQQEQLSQPPSVQNQLKREHDMFFNSMKNVWNPRSVTLASNVTSVTYSMPATSSLPLLEEELKHLHINYKLLRSSENTIYHNQKIANDAGKQEVAFFWGSLLHLINEYLLVTKDMEQKPEVGSTDSRSPVNLEKSRQGSQDTHFKLSPSNLPIRKKETVKPKLDLHRLYKYFEKYPAALKQELEGRNIIIQDNQLHVRKERIPYFQAMVMAQCPLTSLIDREAMMYELSTEISNIVVGSCHDLIQEVIDRGELQSGYWMYLAIKGLNITPDDKIKFWTRSYIHLLESFEYFSLCVKVIQDCSIEEIRQSNKFRYDALCGNCNQEMDKPFCQQCQYVLCSIWYLRYWLNNSLLPIKGLLVWCQTCQHAGHAVEYHRWFSQNEECPSGCGHRCFSQKKLP